MQRQRRPDQADIAREASVPTATVSRVVYKAKGVERQPHGGKLAEMEKRGYNPHAAARGPGL